MNSTQQWNHNQLSEIPLSLSTPTISQTYIIRKSYKDIIAANPTFTGGKNLTPDLSLKVEVNSQPSQRIINFLKCLSILNFLHENALEKAVIQLEQSEIMNVNSMYFRSQ